MDANTHNNRPLSPKLHKGDIVQVTLSDGITIDAVIEGLHIGIWAEQMIRLKQIDQFYDDDNDYGREPAPPDLLEQARRWAPLVGFDLRRAQLVWFAYQGPGYPG